MQKSEPLPKLNVDDTLSPDAPSGIGLTEMVADDLLVIRLYRALAIRHDALVESVLKHLQNQAK